MSFIRFSDDFLISISHLLDDRINFVHKVLGEFFKFGIRREEVLD